MEKSSKIVLGIFVAGQIVVDLVLYALITYNSDCIQIIKDFINTHIII